MNNFIRNAGRSLTIGVLFAVYTGPAIGGVGEGLELYNSYCSVCHGEAGEGQAMGKSLNDRSANSLSDAEVVGVIKMVVRAQAWQVGVIPSMMRKSLISQIMSDLFRGGLVFC